MTKQEIADQLLTIAGRATNNADRYYIHGNDEMADLWRYIFNELYNLQYTIRNY